MSSVLVYGSGECEQLGLGDDAPAEIKKPRLIKLFTPPIKVRQIACGGMHTLVLTTQGEVYSWGCNDEGALGRSGAENVPMLVDKSLDNPMTNVSAGDSHSIAYNTSLNMIYRWGLYRNALSGKIEDVQKTPIRIGVKELKDLKLKKVASGAHHTLALASGRVFGWGDPETGKTGRKLRSRNKNQQSLIIEAIGLKKVHDIFCGVDSSFAINEDKNGNKHVYSWGLNNWGQLGIGHRENECTPTEIKEFRNKDIRTICGGAQHSIALTYDGKVYTWGKNEEGQLGIGDTYSKFSREKQEEYMKLNDEERKLKEETDKLIREAKEKGDKKEVRKLTTSHKKSIKKLTALKEGNEDVENILYFTTPQLVNGLSNIFFINCGSTYNYAIGKRVKKAVEEKEVDDKMNVDTPSQPQQKSENKDNEKDMSQDTPKQETDPLQAASGDSKMTEVKPTETKPAEGSTHAAESKPEESKEKPKSPEQAAQKPVDKGASNEVDERLNVVYSWGIGNSYVLGNKDEDTVYTPQEVKPEQYKNLNPISVSCGTLHVVVKAINPDEKEEDYGLDPTIHITPPEIAKEQVTEGSGLGKKRKREEMENDPTIGNHRV